MKKLALALILFALPCSLVWASTEMDSGNKITVRPTVAETVESEADSLADEIEAERAEAEFQASATFEPNSYLYQFPRKIKREFWEVAEEGATPPPAEELQANILNHYERTNNPNQAVNFFSPRNLAFFGIFLALGVAGFLFWFLRLEKELNESEMEINGF